METTLIIMTLGAVLIDIAVSIFIVITGSAQHDRIEKKVDRIMKHLGIKLDDDEQEG